MSPVEENAYLSVSVSPSSSLQTLYQKKISYLYDVSQTDLYDILGGVH